MGSICYVFESLFTLSVNILFLMVYEVFIYAISVEHVRVGYIVNICVTHLGTMHLT
jgi:hypothetical protein